MCVSGAWCGVSDPILLSIPPSVAVDYRVTPRCGLLSIVCFEVKCIVDQCMASKSKGAACSLTGLAC